MLSRLEALNLGDAARRTARRAAAWIEKQGVTDSDQEQRRILKGPILKFAFPCRSNAGLTVSQGWSWTLSLISLPTSASNGKTLRVIRSSAGKWRPTLSKKIRMLEDAASTVNEYLKIGFEPNKAQRKQWSRGTGSETVSSGHELDLSIDVGVIQELARGTLAGGIAAARTQEANKRTLIDSLEGRLIMKPV